MGPLGRMTDGRRAHAATAAKMALIIDDIGYHRGQTAPFEALEIPLTFAVLPKLSCSGRLARQLTDNGHEVMLHQPMEPQDPHLHPGPGALFVGDSPREIATVLAQNIENMPQAVGVNNHMGSRFTACGKAIRPAMQTIGQHNLFFIDSLTTHQSLAYRTACKMHIHAASRHVFLDHYRSANNVYRQMVALERHACRFGRAIGIGHPWPDTAAGIQRYLRERRNAVPVQFEFVSSMVGSRANT